jgi:hypothetical protein
MYKMKKAIALLEEDLDTDIKIKATLHYFWTKTTKFNMFSTINVSTGTGDTTLDKTLNLLNKYYSEGFRVFFGFSKSSILSGCLSWFVEHPDAIGVSATSSSDTLNVTKNIYRLQGTDQTTVNSMNVIIQNTIDAGGKIYYVYSEGELASDSVLNYLNFKYGSSNIVTFPVKLDGSNLTLTNVESYYQNVTANDIALIYLFQRDTYYSYFNNMGGLDKDFEQYDMTLNGLPTIDKTTTTLKNKLNVILNKSVTSSILWNEALDYLKESFTPQVLNSLWLITNIVNNRSILNTYSYDGVLEFNEYKDIKYYSNGLYKYTNEGIYENNIISIKDPIYGEIIFNAII